MRHLYVLLAAVGFLTVAPTLLACSGLDEASIAAHAQEGPTGPGGDGSGKLAPERP